MRCKQLFALLLVSVLTLTSLPISVHAEEVTEAGSSTTDTSFDSSDLFDGELIVMIPDEVPLELSDDETAFEGSGFVTAWGTAAASTVLNVTTDTEITYTHELSSSVKVNADVAFGTDGTASWDGTTLRSNVSAVQKAGFDVTASVLVSEIPDIGTYTSVIPFNIEVVKADAVTYYMGYKYVTVQSYTDDDDTIHYEYLPSGDTVAELQAFSTNREDLENAGYDYVVASTSTSLNVPEQVNGIDVVGVSLNSFFANDEISSYVTSVILPASVEGIELTDNTASTSETVITSYNYRTAVKLSKSIPTNAVIRFIFQDTEMFLYYADTYNGVEGYACCGLSTYGISVLEKADTSVVTLEIPDTYKDKPVITLDYTRQGSTVNEGMSFVDTFEEDVYSDIALVCGDNILYVEGAFNSTVAAKSFAPKITSLELNEGLVEIYYDAFKGCSNLQSINIPASITTIGSGAFNGCTSLDSLVFNEGFDGTSLPSSSVFTGAKIGKVSFPSSVTTLNMTSLSGAGVVVLDFDNNYEDMTLSGSAASTYTNPIIEFNDVSYLGVLSSDYKCTNLSYDEDYNIHIEASDITADNKLDAGSSVYKYLCGFCALADSKIIFEEGITHISRYMVEVPANYATVTVQLPSTITTLTGENALYGDIIVTGDTDLRGVTLGKYALDGATIENLTVYTYQTNTMYVATQSKDTNVTNLYLALSDDETVDSITLRDSYTNVYFEGTEEEFLALVPNYAEDFSCNVYFECEMP